MMNGSNIYIIKCWKDQKATWVNIEGIKKLHELTLKGSNSYITKCWGDQKATWVNIEGVKELPN